MNEKIIVKSRFVTLGYHKKHRLSITALNFFSLNKYHTHYYGYYKIKNLVSCDLLIDIKCEKESFMSAISQSGYGRIKGDSLILIVDVDFQKDSFDLEIKKEEYELKISYIADHQYLNEIYGKQCMAVYNKKRKRNVKSFKETIKLYGKPMQGGGCSPR